MTIAIKSMWSVALALALLTQPASAAPPRDGFIKSCQAQMYMSQAACGCLADKAEKQLDADGIAYLSLAATDVTHTAAAAKAMSPAQMAKIDKFMKTEPHACEAANP